jgi:hypothetical protein
MLTKRQIQQNPGSARMIGRIGGSLSGPRLTPQRATTCLVQPNVKSQPPGGPLNEDPHHPQGAGRQEAEPERRSRTGVTSPLVAWSRAVATPPGLPPYGRRAPGGRLTRLPEETELQAAPVAGGKLQSMVARPVQTLGQYASGFSGRRRWLQRNPLPVRVGGAKLTPGGQPHDGACVAPADAREDWCADDPDCLAAVGDAGLAVGGVVTAAVVVLGVAGQGQPR